MELDELTANAELLQELGRDPTFDELQKRVQGIRMSRTLVKQSRRGRSVLYEGTTPGGRRVR